MGESKRRNTAKDAYDAERVTARYAKARVVIVCHPKDDAELFRLMVACRAVLPNAVSPARYPSLEAIPVEGIEAPLDGPVTQSVCYDVARGVIRPLTEEEELGMLPGWFPGVLYRLEGKPFTLTASYRDGFLDEAGKPISDPGPLMSGVLRLDNEDVPHCEADAALHHQVECMAVETANAMGYREFESQDYGLEDIEAHYRHLAVLMKSCLDRRPMTHRAWLDFSAATYLASLDPPESTDPDIEEAIEFGIEYMDEVVDAFPEGRLSSVLGPLTGIPAQAWGRRDGRGVGIIFSRIEGPARTLEHPLTNGTEIARLAIGANPEVDARIETFLAQAREVRRNRSGAVHAIDGLHVVTWRDDGWLHVAACPPEDDGPRLRDPLMTEDLVGVDMSRIEDAMPGPDDLAALEFPLDLPDLPHLEDYPFLALAKAVSEGATLADFCASFGAAMRPPTDAYELMAYRAEIDAEDELPEQGREAAIDRTVASNARSADRLEKLGGRRLPRLDALVSELFEVGYRPGAARDAEFLLDACRRGADLADLALEVGEATGAFDE